MTENALNALLTEVSVLRQQVLDLARISRDADARAIEALQRIEVIESQLGVAAKHADVIKQNDNVHDLRIDSHAMVIDTLNKARGEFQSAIASLRLSDALIRRRIGLWSTLFFLGGLVAELLVRLSGWNHTPTSTPTAAWLSRSASSASSAASSSRPSEASGERR